MLEIALFCRNEGSRVRIALASLRDQADGIGEGDLPLRAVVLENGSSDDTAAVAEAAARELHVPGRFEVVVHANLPPGKSAAWNRFIDTSEETIIGFMDCDVGLSPGAIGLLLKDLRADESLDLVSAVPALDPEFQPASFWQSVFAVPYTGLRHAPSVTAHLYLARRERLEPMEPDAMNEDLVLSLRHAGHYSVSVEAQAYATPPSGLSEFVRQRARLRRADAFERARRGLELTPHRRKTPSDALDFYREAGPVKLVAFLTAAGLGKAMSMLPKSQGQGWVPEAGRA